MEKIFHIFNLAILWSRNFSIASPSTILHNGPSLIFQPTCVFILFVPFSWPSSWIPCEVITFRVFEAFTLAIERTFYIFHFMLSTDTRASIITVVKKTIAYQNWNFMLYDLWRYPCIRFRHIFWLFDQITIFTISSVLLTSFSPIHFTF